MTLQLKVPPVAVVLLIAVSIWMLARIAPDWTWEVPARRAGGVLIGMIGLVIIGLGVAEFRRARTTVNPMQPQNAATIVTDGIYRHTRNPMYLGLLLLLLGWMWALANPLALLGPVFFVVYMNRYQIVPEEAALALRFGAAYTTYQQSVRRWI